MEKFIDVNHDLLTGIKWYLAFLFSTTLHEAAHAWAAWKLGDDTAYRGGQVSLDPTPHIRRSPFGMVVVPILSYLAGGWMIGWASAPYNPQWAAAYPRRSAAMSLAGPAANLLLVIVSFILIRVGLASGFFETPFHITSSHLVDGATGGQYFCATMLSIFFSLNVLLCTFNLLPLPPLDGSGALMFFAGSGRGATWLSHLRQPNLQFFGLFIAWKLFDYIYPSIQSFAISLLY